MAGGEDERATPGRKKTRDRITSLFKKPKDRPPRVGEQSTLSHSLGKPLDPADEPQAIQTIGSSSALLATDKANAQVVDAANVAKAISSAVSKEVESSPTSISELWNEAYEDLKGKEASLMKDYEAAMSKDMTTMLGSISLAMGAPDVAIRRKEQMATLVEKKVAEAKKNAWRLKYGDSEVLLRDMAEPIVNLINDAEKFVDGAVSANPYASIAWAGVSLLLPLFLNPSKQAASLATGLSYIGNLIVRSDMRQRLYERCYKTSMGSTELQEYRDTLKELYIRILKFEAKCVVYCSKNDASRHGRDIVKWDGWDSLLEEVTGQEGEFVKLYEIWKDHIAQVEYEKLASRHAESMDALKLISENIIGFQQAVALAQSEKRRAELITWLSSTDPSINYNSAREKHQPETCNWLTQESSDFTNWQNAPNSFLWLNGKAGSGKTILSSSVIKHLKSSYGDNPQVALAYYYFRFDVQEKPSIMALARSLIKQLYCYRPNTPEAVDALNKYREHGQNPELDDLRYALTATVQGFSSVYIVLDALDEFSLEVSERKNLLDFIRQIHELELMNLHVLCTSRREVDIERAFKPLFVILSAGNMDVNLLSNRGKIDYDIGLHIDKTLGSETYDDWSQELKIEARQALVERADGMFQYISCQFEALRDLPSPRAIRKALKDLPVGLDATYDRILQSVKPEYEKPVSNVLKWLAFSRRLLTVEELAEIFILDHNRRPPFDEEDRLKVPKSVLSYLPSLVALVKMGAYREGKGFKIYCVRLAHFSIKEYLISSRIAKSPAKHFSTTRNEAHLHISEACLAYHLHLSVAIQATQAQCEHFKLWLYVAEYWTEHVEHVPRALWTPSIVELTLHILTSDSQSLLNFSRIYGPNRFFGSFGPNWEIGLGDLPTPLYYVVGLGAAKLAEFLLEDGALINELSPRDPGSALAVAALKGNIQVVTALLDHGADVNLQGDYTFGNALGASVFCGEYSIAQLLLDRGADVNIQCGRYGSALIAAAFCGRKDIIPLLLAAGAEINAKGEVYKNALYAAIAGDDIECAELLLARGAKVWPPGSELENQLRKVEDIHGKKVTDRLHKFQENPSSYIAEKKGKSNG